MTKIWTHSIIVTPSSLLMVYCYEAYGQARPANYTDRKISLRDFEISLSTQTLQAIPGFILTQEDKNQAK